MPRSAPATLGKLTESLAQVDVEKVARDGGWCRREPRKISPWEFLKAACLAAVRPQASLSVVAELMPVVGGPGAVSRQAVHERLGPKSAAFMHSVLHALLALQSGARRLTQDGVFRAFARVLIADSTVLPLADSLAKDYPGSANQHRKAGAAAKVQAVYELLTERFLDFGLSSFRRNDQAASPDILSIARARDLALRDMGYFVLKVFAQMNERGIYFLSRLRHRVWIGTLQGESFDLLRHLRRHGSFDGDVLLGETEKVRVRLVAAPVPLAQADERRRRLRDNRDKRCHPTKEQLALCGWTLMITNVPLETWDAQTVCQAYGMRWRIEILFKACKRHFSMADLPDARKEYVETFLWSRLLVAALFCAFLSGPWGVSSCPRARPLSLLKTARFFARCLTYAWTKPLHFTERLLRDTLLRLCCYDTRHDRRNFPRGPRLVSLTRMRKAGPPGPPSVQRPVHRCLRKGIAESVVKACGAAGHERAFSLPAASGVAGATL